MFEKCSIFVGNLAIFCTQKDIEELFMPFGHIVSISIKCDEETSKNLSYGFIKFSTETSALLAMKALNGTILCGRPLRIGKALKEKCKDKFLIPKPTVLETSSIHVTYISYQINKLVTEESLRAIFSLFGDVLDTSIKKSTVDEIGGCQSGYGFVHYANSLAGIESAFKAARSLYDVQVDGVNYICKISHALENHLKTGNFLQSSIISTNQIEHSVPYVPSLPDVASLDHNSAFKRHPNKPPTQLAVERTKQNKKPQPQQAMLHHPFNNSATRLNSKATKNMMEQHLISPTDSPRQLPISPPQQQRQSPLVASRSPYYSDPNLGSNQQHSRLLSTRMNDFQSRPPLNVMMDAHIMSQSQRFEALFDSDTPFGGMRPLRSQEQPQQQQPYQAADMSYISPTSVSSSFSHFFDDHSVCNQSVQDSKHPLDQFHHCNLTAFEAPAPPVHSNSFSWSPSFDAMSPLMDQTVSSIPCHGLPIW